MRSANMHTFDVCFCNVYCFCCVGACTGAARVALLIALFHIPGHMQPLLSGILWGSQASLKLKLSRRCYRNDSSTRNTIRVLLYSVSTCFLLLFVSLRLVWVYILMSSCVYQRHRHSILFRHRLLRGAWWKSYALSERKGMKRHKLLDALALGQDILVK